jgi:hypothetical protein
MCMNTPCWTSEIHSPERSPWIALVLANDNEVVVLVPGPDGKLDFPLAPINGYMETLDKAEEKLFEPYDNDDCGRRDSVMDRLRDSEETWKPLCDRATWVRIIYVRLVQKKLCVPSKDIYKISELTPATLGPYVTEWLADRANPVVEPLEKN